MAVISIRVDDEVQSFLEGRHVSPGGLAKQLLEGEVRRMRQGEAREWLATHSRTLPRPSIDVLREDRHAH